MTEISNSRRLMELFRGYGKAYGTYNPSGLGGEGKQKPDHYKREAPVKEQNFDEHITGKQPIGIYLLDDGEQVSFGAIDIDEYPINHAALSKKLIRWKLPFIVCNSKSGGAHIYIFFREPEEPEMVIKLLKGVSAALGYPKAEIFPKQLTRPPGGYGNFINLPFFGHSSLSYSCWEGDKKLGLDGFLDLAERSSTSGLELEQLLKEAGLLGVPLSSDTQSEEGIIASGRNDYLFRFGCQLIRLIKDEATLLQQLKEKNLSATSEEHENFEIYGPLEVSEVIRIYQSIVSNAGADKTTSVSQLVEELNKKHAHVMVSGKARILNIKQDPVHGWNIHDFSMPSDFRSLYSNQIVKVGDKIKSVGEAWLTHRNRLSFQGVTFNPNGTEADYYNLYQGLPVEPLEGDCGLYLEHIRNNLCRGDDELYEYVLNWMADAVQNPGTRPGVALAIRGKQGVGKGVFVKVFASLFGAHFIQVTQSSHLVGNFNAHLRDKLLVFADEAFWAGDKKAEGQLKGLVTEDNLLIEMKGVDSQSSPNYIRLIMASNNEWIIPASGDQRRFVVIEANENRMRDSAYFGAIIKQIEDGGRDALMHLLLTKDLNGVNLRKIPQTRALVEQKLHSLDSVGQWLYSCLDEGYIESPGERGTTEKTLWQEQINTSDFFDSYLYFCKRNSNCRAAPKSVFGKRLNIFLPSIVKRRATDGNNRTNKYILPPIASAREEFIMANKLDGLCWAEEEGTLI